MLSPQKQVTTGGLSDGICTTVSPCLAYHWRLTNSSRTWTGHSMRGDSGANLPIPEEEPVDGLISDSIPLTMFSCPGAAGFKVRGPNYLQDKKKVRGYPWGAHVSPLSLHDGGGRSRQEAAEIVSRLNCLDLMLTTTQKLCFANSHEQEPLKLAEA